MFGRLPCWISIRRRFWPGRVWWDSKSDWETKSRNFNPLSLSSLFLPKFTVPKFKKYPFMFSLPLPFYVSIFLNQVCLPITLSWLLSSVQSLSRVQLFMTPWIPVHQASLSITNSRSSLKLTSIESVMPSSLLIPYRPLLLLPPIPTNIRVFSNESTLCMRWQSTGISALASVLPKNTQDWAPLEWTCWISLQSKGLARVFSKTTV